MERIRVMVVGAGGRMGREVVAAVTGAEDMSLVATVDAAACGEVAAGVPVEADLAAALARTRPDVAVDFTQPDAVMANLHTIIGAGVAAVAGTTGFSNDDLQTVAAWCDEQGAPCFIAPNFAVGAVLMMRFAEHAARFLPDAEIVEMHHNRKLDAPSGTAMNTARRIAAARTGTAPDATEAVTLEGARGGDLDGVRVHSIRLPGFVASQAVIFGGTGQTLTIRHDTTDRTSFMPGVLLAVRRVRDTRGLTVGLEHFLDG